VRYAQKDHRRRPRGALPRDRRASRGKASAERIGRHSSMVSRTVARRGDRERDPAVAAGRVAAVLGGRPKTRKLDTDPDLREQVLGTLRPGARRIRSRGLCWDPGSHRGQPC